MNNKKSTKRALITSMLSLVLCMSMLIGTTFAWFTDSVTSGNNKIVSGNLDVELWHCPNNEAQWGFGYDEATGTEIKGDTALFLNADGKPILWEPGAGAGETFRVKNAGSLALKFMLNLKTVNATKTPEGKDLTDVLNLQVIELVNNENGVPGHYAGDVNYEGLFGDGYIIEGELLPGETADFNVAIDWFQSANDNDYNVAGGLGITFGIDLIATQLTYEKDSYDDQYDADAIKDGIRVERDGIVYIYTEDGQVILYKVTSEYTKDTLVVPDGVTSIGFGTEGTEGTQVFSSNASVKNVVFASTVRNIGYQAFKDSVVESVTLNEGLVEIGAFAFNGAKNLKSFNIPSTVKIIGKRAFRSTAATEVVLHAGIESITESFRDMPNLTTVTVEGNVAFDNYAFRHCPNLTSIYLLGDDVQFTGSQFATRADNGDANGITIYVKNATVAARVYAAQTSAYGYEVKILGDSADGSDAEEITYVKDDAQLENAIKNASTTGTNTILLASGTYSGNYELTLAHLGEQKGDFEFLAGGDVIFSGTTTLGYRNQGTGATMLNANVTFDGITFDHAEAAKHSLDIQDVKSLTLKDCTIIGGGEYGISSARGNATGASSIVGCTFIDAGMQLLGNFATGLVIDGCDFDNSRINVQAGNGVTVQNCTFNNTLTDANVGDSFYLIRSNSTPITVKNCDIIIDSTVNGIATAQEKWGIFWNRGTTDWTVSNVTVDLTDAAAAQTELLVTKTTSTGAINGTVDFK